MYYIFDMQNNLLGKYNDYDKARKNWHGMYGEQIWAMWKDECGQWHSNRIN
jgi:hypothetical protein